MSRPSGSIRSSQRARFGLARLGLVGLGLGLLTMACGDTGEQPDDDGDGGIPFLPDPSDPPEAADPGGAHGGRSRGMGGTRSQRWFDTGSDVLLPV